MRFDKCDQYPNIFIGYSYQNWQKCLKRVETKSQSMEMLAVAKVELFTENHRGGGGGIAGGAARRPPQRRGARGPEARAASTSRASPSAISASTSE